MSGDGAHGIEDVEIVTPNGTERRASRKVDDCKIAKVKTGGTEFVEMLAEIVVELSSPPLEEPKEAVT